MSPGKSVLGIHFDGDQGQQQLDEENIDEPEEGIEPFPEAGDSESSFIAEIDPTTGLPTLRIFP